MLYSNRVVMLPFVSCTMEWLRISVTVILYFSSVHCHVDGGNSDSSLLTLSTISQNTLVGSYFDPHSGCGINFNSTSDTLYVESLDGSLVLSAEESVGVFRVIGVKDKHFIQHRVTDHEQVDYIVDYVVPETHGLFYGEKNPGTLRELVSKLGTVDHGHVVKQSIEELTSGCEVQLMRHAAIGMGRQGITGLNYPSVLPFYLSALQTTNYQNSVARTSVTSELSHSRLRRSSCSDKCPPCKDKECLGMCGPGCECWDWACGNCCFHLGCHGHDLCCRSQPDSLSCFMPVSFECNKEYVC